MANHDETAIEQEIRSKRLNAPRLTPKQIDEQIAAEYVVRASDAFKDAPVHDALKCLTLCVLVLKNGFTVTGESACASPENYDFDIGHKIARDNARSKIWAFEGYTLRNSLTGRAPLR